MRIIRLLLLISLIMSCLFAFASCDDTEELATPQGVEIEKTTLTLKWKEVSGARLYTISIQKDGEEPREAIGSKNYYSLTSLTEGNYTIKVKANGKDGVSRDSDWSVSIPFYREKESGMIFTLINGGTEYEVSGKGIATGDIVIPNTYRDLPVTSIGKKAFFNKSDVSTVVIGDNVKSIGDFAFANCSYVTSIELPKGLTSIGESAFASCRLMANKIVIPEGVTNIPKNAFAYCLSIEEIELSNSITRIESSAFTDCSKIKSLVLPDKLEYVGVLAFSSCKSLTSLTFGENVKEIDNYAFSELTSLESVVIPDSVEVIGEYAFYLSESLRNISLGAGIKKIGYSAFFNTALWNSAKDDVYVGKWFLGCKDNTKVAIEFKEDTVGIASYALYSNTSIEQILLKDNVKYIGKAAFAGMESLNVAVIGGATVEIGDEAFANSKRLSAVYLGAINEDELCISYSSLEKIGDYAFRGCETLEHIEMPSSLKSVGTYAFRDTAMFKAAKAEDGGVVYAGNWAVDYNENIASGVTVKDGTVGIANYAFYNCSVLTTVSIAESVKIIGRAAFYDCSSLAEVKLPSTLEVIDDYTFYRCKSLELFTLPPMLTYIGRSAFYKCATASSVKLDDTDSDIFTIPSGVEYIGDYAFYGCGYSERAAIGEEQYYNYFGTDVVVINGSVKYMGSNAFYNFCSLKHVYLGATEMIGEKAFYKCEQLVSVDFGTSLKTIGEKAFYKCDSLETVQLPMSVTDIGSYAFYRCESIKNLDLGGAATIGSFAFYGNYQLEEITIPSTVTFIGKQAFRNCKGLTAVILPSSVETVEQHAFYGCASLTLYVTSDKAPESWHKFWNSSYRPVVYGCTLSEDDSYVLYIVKGTVPNLNSQTTLSDPIRNGYTFLGWGNNSTANPSFTSENLSEAENGKKLYAIWAEEQN